MDWMTIPGDGRRNCDARGRGLAIKVFVEKISPGCGSESAEVDGYPVEIEATGEFHAK
jgi:hypothetical protein